MVLGVAVGAGSYSGGRAGARRLFFENPDYRLSTIEAHTDGTLQREQILQTAGLHEGETIFRVNLATVHDRLQQLPQVVYVQVVLSLPEKLAIKITEPKPTAYITSQQQSST